MLGFVLLFLIARAYANLAKQHNKSAWLYGVLGIIIYYGSTFLIGLIMGMSGVTFTTEYDSDYLKIILISVITGLIVTGLVYLLLKRTWEKEDLNLENETLDSELLKNDD